MYAIVAFKRPSARYEGFYEVAFDIRDFGCFNGFNVADAFTPNPSDYGNLYFDLWFDKVHQSGEIREWTTGVLPTLGDRIAMRGSPNAEVGRIADPNTNRITGAPWECLGIGWMAYSVGSQVLPYIDPIENGRYRDTTTANGPYFGLNSNSNPNNSPNYAPPMLNRNTIWGRYYDPHTGGYQASRRDFTPNERFLERLFHSIESNGHTNQQYFYRASRMWNAIAFSREYRYMLFDMVGSERPSGLAVAYLQIYRNTCEKMSNGGAGLGARWTAGSKILMSMKQGHQPMRAGERRYNPWPMELDTMPVLSFLFHNGDDSDIVNFAEDWFIGYAIKHGLLNCGHMFRDSRPMVEEGRYNKGGQADALCNKTHDEVAKRKCTDLFRPVGNALQKLNEYLGFMQRKPDVEYAMRNYMSTVAGNETDVARGVMEQAAATANNEAQFARQLGAIGDWIKESPNYNVHAAVEALVGASKELPSFRQPHVEKPKEKATRKSSKPMGFAEWTGQAEGQDAVVCATVSSDTPSDQELLGALEAEGFVLDIEGAPEPTDENPIQQAMNRAAANAATRAQAEAMFNAGNATGTNF